MFQRLTTAANGLFENRSEVFQYEMSRVPSTMFDCNRLLREACKSNIADAIWVCGSDCIHEIDGESFQYVLDGSSLLQRLPWTHGDTFGDITQMYVDHVIRKYKDPVVPSVKDITRLRRTKGIISPNINFTSSMPCKTEKELFVSNSHNKQALVNMLCDKPNENDIRCKNATDDADLLITQTAVDCALSSEVVVIDEDTDLLVLLIHHVNQHRYHQSRKEALTCSYGRLPLERLNILRWRKFTARVITGNTSVQVKSLPPTSDLGQVHGLRFYYQSQKWMSEEVDIDPTGYGWEIKRRIFLSSFDGTSSGT
ncbi:unnamed protein product [Mytilus coruscus]|uniref:Uncharacterized protein n=1 Tax=Mytilus coruscus TaxID=42192 RepID=A0A6J8E544_MYTCO|nr:unnamed protein product [Mytilus coruscus]